MNTLYYEFMLSLRRLGRRRLQTGMMLATFTVSITLSLVSWSLYHTMFLKQPDFDPAGRLVVIGFIKDTPGARHNGISREDLRAWQERQTSFSELAGFSIYRSIFIATKDASQRHLGALMSTEALRMVGAKPLIGRLFTADEDKLKCAPVLILSQRLWENRFGADPSVLGRVVKVDGYDAAIVGVLPDTFHFPNNQDVWLPLGFDNWYDDKDTDNNTINALGRLKPGVTIGQAMQEFQAILVSRGSGTVAARYNMHADLTPIRDYFLFPYMKQSALILLALSIVFVLVSCANVANLVMIDFFGRTPELAALLSLGLPRAASIRSLLFQIGILVTVGGLVALAVLTVAAPLVHQSFVLMLTPYWLHFEFAWHHIAMVVGLAVLSAAVAVIVPTVYLLMVSPEKIIREAAGSNRGTGRGPWRRLLLVGQLALLTVLGVAAGLLMQSNYQLREEKWGYDASKIFLGKLDMPQVAFPDQTVRLGIFRKIVAEISRLPGVAGAAVTFNPPGYSGPAQVRYAMNPDLLANGHEEGHAYLSESSETIFDALGVPFLAGSTWPVGSKPGDTREIVINAGLAGRLWPRQDPLGKTFYIRLPWTEPKEASPKVIVRGVVRDYQASGPQSANNDVVAVSFIDWTPSTLFLIVRGDRTLPSAKELNDAVWRIDPRVVPYFPDSIKHQVDMVLGFVRLTTRLTAVFALAAVLLCGIGVYSITVAQIMQRNREFGIRLALGIEADRLWVRFVRGHLVTAAIGVGLGLVIALGVMHALKSLLFGIEERDPVTYLVVALTILVVSALASIPSLFRLRRINPADCLRSL
jgi:putative ABC transport system permease protein